MKPEQFSMKKCKVPVEDKKAFPSSVSIETREPKLFSPRNQNASQNSICSGQMISFCHRYETGCSKSDKLFATEPLKISQYFVDTQNEMIEHRKRLNEQNDNNHFKTGRLSKNKVSQYCHLFLKKVKRTCRGVFQKQIEKELQLLNQSYSQEYNTFWLKSLMQSAHALAMTLTFVLSTLSFTFLEICQSNIFAISQFALSASSLLLLGLVINQNWKQIESDMKLFLKIQGWRSSLILYFLGAIIGIFNSTLYFCHRYQNVSQFGLIVLIFIPALVEESKILQLKIISKFKLLSLAFYSELIQLLVKSIVYAHLLAVALSKFIIEIEDMNWITHQHVAITSRASIYGWSFFEGISIVFTAGIHFPSPHHEIEMTFFVVLRFIIVLLSFYNLKIIVSYLFSLKQRKNVSIRTDLYQTLRKYLTEKQKYLTYDELLTLAQQTVDEQEHIQCKRNSFQSKQLNFIKSHSLQNLLAKSTILFSSLNQKICSMLATKCRCFVIAAETIISDYNFTYDWLILAKGKLAVLPPLGRRSFSLHCMESSGPSKAVLLNHNWLKGQLPHQRIKTVSTSIIIKIEDEQFRNAIKINDFACEFMWYQRHKNSIKPDEFEVLTCKLCSSNHSKCYCSKLHYIPFSSEVIHNHLKKNKEPNSRIGKQVRILRVKSCALKYYWQLEELNLPIQSQIIQMRMQLESIQQISEGEGGLKISSKVQNRHKNQLRVPENNQKIIHLQKLLSQIQNRLDQPIQYSDQVWIVRVDQLHDYKYYFPSRNPSRLSQKSRMI